MKTTYKIAKTELKVLFYSPVAWLILIIFTFQAATLFTDLFSILVRMMSMGTKLESVTLSVFYKMGGMNGYFTDIQNYLYLYIPLLTMGVMSREIGSGSIKLLYSSPITNTQIILGKFLSLMIFGLVIIGIVGLLGVYGVAAIKDPDIPVVISGLLGLYLLICAYSAIGLFMSSITSYTVVAAMGTLAIFGLMSYVKGIGQGIAFVRDITYWFAISGRCDTFISGMITTEDVLYFIIVIGLFLTLTILKLQGGRQKTTWSLSFAKYAGVVVVTVLLGYLSSRPILKNYYDVTRTKLNTLTKSSQDVVSKLKGGLTIKTYVNMLDKNYWIAVPENYKFDVQRFDKYVRFKPEIKLTYDYYYHKNQNAYLDKHYWKLNDKELKDTLSKLLDWKFEIKPYKAIQDQVNLEPENFAFVRVLERENGEKTFLRVYNDGFTLPNESEITAAFKRLVMKLPVVGFLKGHGERESDGIRDKGYNSIAREKTFRYSMLNQGFDFKDVTLEHDIPSDIRILIIAEMKTGLSPEESERLSRYIAKGGNLIIAGEPGRQQVMNPVVETLGVKFLPGILVNPTKQFQPDLLLLKPTKEATEFSYYLKDMLNYNGVLTMPGATGLAFTNDMGFNVKTLFQTADKGSWTELETTNFVDDTVKLNSKIGEVEKSVPTVIALSRKVNKKDQKILITGDADWLSNGELAMQRNEVQASNFSLIMGGFFWLSDNEVPIDMRRDPTPDNAIKVGKDGWGISIVLLKWILPSVLIVLSLLIWIRRRGR